MNFDLKKELSTYIPKDETERINLEKIKEFLNTNDNCYSRSNLKGHIVADAIVMHRKTGDILLNHHKILDMWVFFGGHSDGNPNSLEVAKRELSEESYITEFEDFGGKILDVDVHQIPTNEKKHEPEHLHYSIRFLFLVNNRDFSISSESKEAKWVSIEQAKELMTAPDKLRVLNKVQNVYRKMLDQEDREEVK